MAVAVEVGAGGEAGASGLSDTAATPAVITGKVTFAGTPPERKEFPTDEFPTGEESQADMKGVPVLSDEFVVEENGGFQWVFAYIANPPEGDYPVPEELAVIDQLNGRYDPHVLWVRARQRVLAANKDPSTHYARSFARKNRSISYAQPYGKDAETGMPNIIKSPA